MRNYNNEILESFCKNNDITLSYDYSDENLNDAYRIEGKCKTKNCKNEFNLSFKHFFKNGGICHICAKKKPTKFTYTKLKQYCDDNNIELLEDYSNVVLSQTIIIKGNCLTEKCCKQFSKQLVSFLKTGAYCTTCILINAKEKEQNTNMEKFGTKYPSQNKDIMNKMKATNMEKFGTKYPSQNKDVINKMKETNMEKYGVEIVSQNKDVIDKMKATNMEKYGVEIVSQNKNFFFKMKKTNMIKYGVEHCMQNADIAEKSVKNAFKAKKYIFPSGKIISCQGYEPFALDELILNECVDENTIITSRKDVPEIWYFDDNGTKRRYYVDIFIESQNRCIEVKSTWTFQLNQKNIILKHEAVQSAGYISEIWVYDNKGNIVDFRG